MCLVKMFPFDFYKRAYCRFCRSARGKLQRVTENQCGGVDPESAGPGEDRQAKDRREARSLTVRAPDSPFRAAQVQPRGRQGQCKSLRKILVPSIFVWTTLGVGLMRTLLVPGVQTLVDWAVRGELQFWLRRTPPDEDDRRAGCRKSASPVR
jgi:hypothetical protein